MNETKQKLEVIQSISFQLVFTEASICSMCTYIRHIYLHMWLVMLWLEKNIYIFPFFLTLSVHSWVM